MSGDGGTIITGNGIALYRLLSLRAAVRLESRGVKVARRSLRLQAARELGMSGKPSFAAVLAALDAKVREAEALVRPGEIRSIGDAR